MVGLGVVGQHALDEDALGLVPGSCPLEEALQAAAAQNITGQAVTPFVLSFLHERSGGKTLEVNRELVIANAGLAARVAAS